MKSALIVAFDGLQPSQVTPIQMPNLSRFAAAGVGMLIGLITYLLGQRWVIELPESAVYEPPEGEELGKKAGEHIMTEGEAETTPSSTATFSRLSPAIFTLIGVALVIGSPALWLMKLVDFDNFVAHSSASRRSTLLSCSAISASLASAASNRPSA